MDLGSRTPHDINFWLAVCPDSEFLLVSLCCFSICLPSFRPHLLAGAKIRINIFATPMSNPDHVSITHLVVVSAASTIATISNQSVVRYRVGEPFLKLEPFHVTSTFAAGTSCCDELCQNVPDERRRWIKRSQMPSAVCLDHFPISLVLQNEVLVVGRRN